MVGPCVMAKDIWPACPSQALPAVIPPCGKGLTLIVIAESGGFAFVHPPPSVIEVRIKVVVSVRAYGVANVELLPRVILSECVCAIGITYRKRGGANGGCQL